MAVNRDNVSGAEFQRWMEEEGAFRFRLEQRLAGWHNETSLRLDRIEANGREANGKTAEHAKLIAVIMRDLEAIRAELGDTEQTVHSIKDEGCSQYAAHVAILGGEGLPAAGRPFALGAKATLLDWRKAIKGFTGETKDRLLTGEAWLIEAHPEYGTYRDNVRASISAEIDFSQTESTSELFKPNQGDSAEKTVRSQQSTEVAGGGVLPAAGAAARAAVTRNHASMCLMGASR